MLLLNELPHLHSLIICQPHKIDTTGQIADINGSGWLRDLVGNEFLSVKVHYG
jgi:hypothetical protein